MDETKKKPSLKELLSMDLSTLTKKKSKETESASVTKKATKNKKIMEKKIPKRAIELDIGNNSKKANNFKVKTLKFPLKLVKKNVKKTP